MRPEIRAGLAIAAGAAYLCWEIAREDDRQLRLFLAGCAALTLGLGAALAVRTVAPSAGPLPGASVPVRLHLVPRAA